MTGTGSGLMSNYGRYPIAFSRGRGCRLWDDQDRPYLDFLSGFGVNALGHAPPRVVAAVQEQAERLIHVSNLYRIPQQEMLARRLAAGCFADRMFFCNSGAEANEAAIKLVRKCMKDRGQPGRFEIITAAEGFHGRTLATLTASALDKVQRGYDPLPPGFRYAAFDDLPGVERKISSYTAGIMVEAIQGEAGVRVPSPGYLEGLREIADRHGLLLVVDEIQTGAGRTGRMWCHQWSSITPDIMTASKGLASGLPMGVCMATEQVAGTFSPGSHGSTSGGNPLVCAAALATLDELEGEHGVISQVSGKGEYLMERLRGLQHHHRMVKDVRGRGLMVAIELNAPAEDAAAIALSRGLLVNCVQGTTLRLLPPLVVTREEIDEATTILGGVLMDLF
ncbi:MAG: aspartate aminotransferase family protein [Magnetococcales bacterium]|nr:aspartate aminotransferase family protein [Magnetococcales bacterium]